MPGSPDPDPAEPDPDAIARLDLRAATGAADVAAIGVTVAPDGRRFVLDVLGGLYELSPDGTAALALSILDFPAADQPVGSSFTDIAALGDDRFALTAMNDGFLLDLGANTLTQHFCYVPPALPDGINQLTLSVAFDPEAGLLHAQPQSFDQGGLFASQIGAWDRESGVDLAWYDLSDVEYLAGGMAVEQTGVLLLGRGAALDRYTIADRRLSPAADLAGLGLVQIDGVAIDRAAGVVLVVDGLTDELVEIPLAELAQ